MNIFPILSDPRTWNFLCAARGSHGAALLGKHTQLSIKSDEYNYINFFFVTFFIYNIYFLWEKTLAWGHSNPATYVLKMEGETIDMDLAVIKQSVYPGLLMRLADFADVELFLRFLCCILGHNFSHFPFFFRLTHLSILLFPFFFFFFFFFFQFFKIF